ncbi:MAG: GAF domain-containing protein [Gemmatimonadota bacterium]
MHSRLTSAPLEHLELLYQASLEFNSTLDPNELLPRVFDRALDLLDAEAGSVWLRRDEHVVCTLARGPAGDTVEGLELPVGAGIVGDVARTGEPEIVADARADQRFVHQVDDATGFVTRSVLAAALKAEGRVLGVLQVLNKRSGSGCFDETDLALLEGLGLTAGLALRNAQLHEVERHARDLRALLGISREITSTLDVERLALSLVNLGSQAFDYDRAAIGLTEGGRLVLRAISGREELGALAEADRELERLIAWLVERDEIVYVRDLTAGDGLESAVRSAFGAYVERTGVRSLCLAPLRDDEGRLGALYLEANKPEFLEPGELEAVELLANQASVALRNAQLYDQVPFAGLLERSAAWRRRSAGAGGRKLLRRLAVPAAVVLALVLIPCGERIKPEESRLLPGSRSPVRASVGGLIQESIVDEGTSVRAGEVVAVLRDDDLRMESDEAQATLAVRERDAAAARARGDQAAAQVAQLEIRELEQRIGLLRERSERMRLRAPVAGVVLTPRPRERVGERLQPGETFVVLGRTDRLELESRISQADVERVRAGQTIRVRVAARPEYTFVGSVTRVASYADSTGGGSPTFVVRSDLENGRGLLRPGMEARAKIVGEVRPLGWFLARPFVRWVQLRWWR